MHDEDHPQNTLLRTELNITALKSQRQGYSVSNNKMKGTKYKINTTHIWEPSGSVVECLTRDRRAAGSSLTSVTALCP